MADHHPSVPASVFPASRLGASCGRWTTRRAPTWTLLGHVLPLCPPGVRVMAWVKPFAAFKRNVSVAYAWEPVIVAAARKPVVSKRMVYRDWISESITLKKGLTGVKPETVCRWAFEVVGALPDDDLDDIFPGSGAVQRAWDAWRSELRLEVA